MTSAVLILSLSYAAVAALLLNLNLATRHSTPIKFGAILLVTSLYLGTWYGHREMTGWATAQPLPEEFRVYWLMIDEPDKVTGEPGTIFFWVRTLDEAGFVSGPPRAHRIAWSEAAAKAAQSALEQLEEGELLNGHMTRNAVIKSDAQYSGDVTADAPGEAPGFEFSRVPPPSLPPKVMLDR